MAANLYRSITIPRSPPELLPKHTIFLSHSGQDKPFVEQLSKDLEAVRLYPFFDQERGSLPIGEKFGPLIFEAAKQCLVAVIVLSPAYLESKWPMQELIAFHESMKAGHPVKFVPLFYKLTPDDLHGEPRAERQGRGPKLSSKEFHQRLAPALAHTEANEGENGVKRAGRWEEWKKTWQALRDVRGGKVQIDEHLCEAAIAELRKFNGLLFSRYKNSECAFRKGAVDEICKLSPPAVPFDTSDIMGCARLCEEISKMFVEKRPGIQYLGVYGNEGSGKSTLCCEAMCSYFQKDFQGRLCRVELEFGGDCKAGEKKRETRLRQAIQHLFGLDKKMQAISAEKQLRTYLQDKLRSQSVFLVVDNVSSTTRDEAEFYVKAAVAPGSKVLLTSRFQKLLEAILGGEKYCRPVPGLKLEEAEQLVLSKAARSKLNSTLDAQEEEIVRACVDEARAEGCNDDDEQYYHPLTLRTWAIHLRDNGEDNIPKWAPIIQSLRSSNAAKDIYHLHLLQFEKLDKTSRLVFLDLAIFADGMFLTHEDLHSDSVADGMLVTFGYNYAQSFHHAVTYIALLHGLTLQQAEMKVKMLQETPFVTYTSENTEISEIGVPQQYEYFARWLTKRDGEREEKDWCMICKPEVEEEEYYGEDEGMEEVEFANLPNITNPSKLVRVSVSKLALSYSDHLKIRQWRYVAYLELKQVSYLRCLDLQGLHSLRVLRVEECDDLEKIVVTCETSSPSDGHPCYQNPYQKKYQELLPSSGCMPNLRFVQLVDLLGLKYALFPTHCWNLETLWFLNCPDLACLPDLRLCKKLKKLRLPCGDFQGFQGLSGNKALTELAFHWDPNTVSTFTEEMRTTLLLDMMNLTNLKVLDIVDEREVYDWIGPAGIRTLNVGKLVHLTFLDLSYASSIEEVAGLELLSHSLTSLSLYGCCALRTLPKLADFKSLNRLCIGHCHSLDLADRDDVPGEFRSFHAFGASCSFGEHECLDPEDHEWSVCKMCEPHSVPTAPERAGLGGDGDDQAANIGPSEYHKDQSGVEQEDGDQVGVEVEVDGRRDMGWEVKGQRDLMGEEDESQGGAEEEDEGQANEKEEDDEEQANEKEEDEGQANEKEEDDEEQANEKEKDEGQANEKEEDDEEQANEKEEDDEEQDPEEDQPRSNFTTLFTRFY